MNLHLFSAGMRTAPLSIVVLSAIVAVSAYLQALHYPFVSDDGLYIVENNKLAGLHLSELWRLLIEPYNRYSEFLPLRDLSYWFDLTLFGLNPAAFRLHNIFLYLICLLLVYMVTLSIWRYFRPEDADNAPWVAAAVTSLFALQPSHAELVVWISGRKDLLSTLFSLLALWLAIGAKRERDFSAPHAVATLVAMLAAMLSKASAFAVAPVIAMLWVIFWRDIPTHSRRLYLLLWPFACLLLAACVALIFATIITTRTPFYFGVEAIIRSLAVLGWLARLSISPESRHFFYPVLEDTSLPFMVVFGAMVLLAAAMTSVAMIIKKGNALSLEKFSIVVFLLLCVPSIQLIPYSLPSLVSDRWLALAVWPVLLLLVALSWRLNFVPRVALLLVFALPWSFQTMERPRDWRSYETLVDTDMSAYPGYYMPPSKKIIIFQLPRGLYRDAVDTANTISSPALRDIMTEIVQADYMVHVKTMATGNPGEAMALLWKLGFKLRQELAQAKWDLPVNELWKTSQHAYTSEWQSLIEEFPDDASVRYSYGLWKMEVHNYKDAITHLRAATESQRLPELLRGEAFNNLGIALLNSGYATEAEAPLHAALEQSPPELSAHCTLSEVYKQTGQIEEAARAAANCRTAHPAKGVQHSGSGYSNSH